MSVPLNPGFHNNSNIVTIRTCGTSTVCETDLRALDLNSDGRKDQDVITQTSGNIGPNGGKARFTFTETRGAKHTVVASAVETDGGTDTTGSSKFTKGIK